MKSSYILDFYIRGNTNFKKSCLKNVFFLLESLIMVQYIPTNELNISQSWYPKSKNACNSHRKNSMVGTGILSINMKYLLHEW